MGSQRVGHNLVTKHTQTCLRYEEDDCDFGNKRPLYKKRYSHMEGEITYRSLTAE